MATTYDKASLVMIPSGYKDDKLYAVKPTDGSGDFTFSRDGSGASPATRVNASGYIEKGRENILLQSNTFSNASWIKASGTTITGGQSGYDGSSDAWLLSKSASFARIEQVINFSGVVAFSVYAKAGTHNFLYLRLDDSGSKEAYFNLSTGAVATNNVITTKVDSIVGGWYRCTIVWNASAGTYARIYPSDVDNGVGNTGAGNIYIQDAQLESGLVATAPAIETTTAPVSAGLLGDMPRLDYSGGATCPSLLLEPSRVNVVEYAEYFDIYTKSNATITNNDSLSPEGLQNASSLVGNGATSSHYIFRNSGTAVSGTDYTISFFAKSGSLDYVQLVMGSGAFGVMHQNFDLSNGTIGSSSGSVTPFIESYANNWYRVGVTITATASTTITPFIALANSSTMSRLASFATSDDVKIYGLQVEVGSYVSSYIPTYGSASTRGGDNCDLSISSLGLTMLDGGSFYFDFVNNDFPITGTNKPTIQLASGAYSNYLGAVGKDLNGDGNLAWSLGYSVTNAYSLPTAETRYKCAFSWDATNLKVFVNGSQVYTTSSFTSAEYNAINLNYSDRKAITEINQVLLFDEQLTDAECIALTTL